MDVHANSGASRPSNNYLKGRSSHGAAKNAHPFEEKSEKKVGNPRTNSPPLRVATQFPTGPWSYQDVQQYNKKQGNRQHWRLHLIPRPEELSIAGMDIPSTALRLSLHRSNSTTELQGTPYESLLKGLLTLPKYATTYRKVQAWRWLLHWITNTDSQKFATATQIKPVSVSFAMQIQDDANSNSQTTPWSAIDRNKILTKPIVITINYSTIEAATQVRTALVKAAPLHSQLSIEFLPLEHRFFRFRFNIDAIESAVDVHAKLNEIGFAEGSYLLENEEEGFFDIGQFDRYDQHHSRRVVKVLAPEGYRALLMHEHFAHRAALVWNQPQPSCSRCGITGSHRHGCNSRYCMEEFHHGNQRLCFNCGKHNHGHQDRTDWLACQRNENEELGCLFCSGRHASTQCHRYKCSWQKVKHYPTAPSIDSVQFPALSSTEEKKNAAATTAAMEHSDAMTVEVTQRQSSPPNASPPMSPSPAASFSNLSLHSSINNLDVDASSSISARSSHSSKSGRSSASSTSSAVDQAVTMLMKEIKSLKDALKAVSDSSKSQINDLQQQVQSLTLIIQEAHAPSAPAATIPSTSTQSAAPLQAATSTATTTNHEHGFTHVQPHGKRHRPNSGSPSMTTISLSQIALPTTQLQNHFAILAVTDSDSSVDDRPMEAIDTHTSGKAEAAEATSSAGKGMGTPPGKRTLRTLPQRVPPPSPPLPNG